MCILHTVCIIKFYTQYVILDKMAALVALMEMQHFDEFCKKMVVNVQTSFQIRLVFPKILRYILIDFCLVLLS